MKKYFLAVTTILLTSLNLAGSAEAACKFTFRVELMKLETVDVGDTSNSMGDMTIMDADLYYKNKPVGTAVFNTYLNRMADPNAVVERRRLEQRLGIAQYHIGEKDSLVTIGEFIYDLPGSPQPYTPDQVRSVTGGIGKFKFAKGQVILHRVDADTFEHRFELNVEPSLCKF
jgi:hypothetical protein